VGAAAGATPPTPHLETFPVGAELSKGTQPTVAQRLDSTLRADVHCTVDRQKLDQARALLSHCIPSGDLGQVLDRALDAVIREMEKRRFAATTRPRGRAPRRVSANARHIPAHVKRDVWARDGGRCTFAGPNGHRCGERRFLEFDHVRPVALGGAATIAAADLRLRCRAHNQYEAERVFGTGFMDRKREAARRARLAAREAREPVREKEEIHGDRVRAIASGLRNLGCRADEARRAAESAVAGTGAEATLEECLRSALRSLGPPRNTRRDVTTAPRAALPKAIESPQEAVLV
jgi:5-methylcytosine-specific restriction endonuclease McrA